MTYIPDDISSLLSRPVEHCINTNTVILKSDKFTDEALGLMVSRDDIFEKIHMATISTAHTAIKGTPVCIINPKAIVYMQDVSTAKLVCPYC
jgi:hypothetical protein